MCALRTNSLFFEGSRNYGETRYLVRFILVYPNSEAHILVFFLDGFFLVILPHNNITAFFTQVCNGSITIKIDQHLSISVELYRGSNLDCSLIRL